MNIEVAYPHDEAVVLPPVHTRARTAYVAFLVFVLAVYSSIAILVPALAKLAPGKSLIALAAVALAWSCALCDRKLRLGLGAGGAALYLFFAIVLSSPLWSLWPGFSLEAAKEAIKYLVGFMVAANLIDSPRRARQALAVIAIGSLFPAFGVLQSFFTGENMVDARASWIGIYANPNFCAYYLVVATPIALALRESAPKSAHRALVRFGWLAAVGLYVAAILLTQSRGGAVGLAAVLLLWVLRSLARGRLAVGILVAVGVALAMTPLSPLNRDDTRENLEGQVDLSAQGRIDAWRTALRIVEDRPVGGVGAGAFVLGYDRYAPGDAGPARTAHSSYAMIAAELGIPALLVFLCAILGCMLAMSRVARDATLPSLVDPAGTPSSLPALALGVQTALFGFLVCSITGSYVFTWPLFFLLGVGAALVRVGLASERA